MADNENPHPRDDRSVAMPCGYALIVIGAVMTVAGFPLCVLTLTNVFTASLKSIMTYLSPTLLGCGIMGIISGLVYVNSAKDILRHMQILEESEKSDKKRSKKK